MATHPTHRTAAKGGRGLLEDEPRVLKFAANNGFHRELRQRVDRYFETTGKRPRGNWQMCLKTAIILVWFAASYVLLVFFAETWWQALLLAVSFALAAAGVAFNIQHDGSHSAYSNYSWINKLAAMTLDLIGASSYLWHFKHVVYHHTCVNIAGHDTDIEVGVLARLAPQQPRRWAHRWQQFYMWPLYGLMAVRWHLQGDFQDIAKGRIGKHRVPRPRGWDLAVFIGGKVFSITLMLVVPMFFHPAWVVILFYLLITGIMGLVMAVVFQLAHCVEEADFPAPEEGTARISNSWAVHQVETTVDFARGSQILTWLLGGLNFQIEHHLFPRICHVHYPAISAIVEEVCREQGVKYVVHRTLLGGLKSHYRWLRRMGKPDATGSLNPVSWAKATLGLPSAGAAVAKDDLANARDGMAMG